MSLSNNSLDFSVVIPTYNGINRLPEVLNKLKQQIKTENITWEIIIVDNNSADNTSDLIKSYQNNWQYPYCLRYLLERKQGAAFARQTGIENAKSPLIGFLDDDNIPDNDWVYSAYIFAQKYPKCGAMGSFVRGDFAGEIPENFGKIKPFLAITDRGKKPLLYNPKLKYLPPSAGLVVRKQAWLESVPEKTILSGRIQDNMLTGEDLEILGYIQSKGWEIWYNPDMKITHKIPAHRLTRSYLIPFMGGIGLSRYVTRMVGVKFYLKPILLLGYFINDLRKIVWQFLKYGTSLQTNLVAACEMELYKKSLISPFYLYFKGYLK